MRNSKPRIVDIEVDIEVGNLLQFYKTCLRNISNVEVERRCLLSSQVTHLFPFAINKQQGDRLHHRKRCV